MVDRYKPNGSQLVIDNDFKIAPVNNACSVPLSSIWGAAYILASTSLDIQPLMLMASVKM